MRYDRYTDRWRRKDQNPRGSRDLISGFSSFFWMTLNFVLGAIGIFITALVLAGWLRFVVFGKVDNDIFWRRLRYDVTHLNERSSQMSLKRFFQGVTSSSESSSSIF